MASWLSTRQHPFHVMELPPEYSFEELDAQFTHLTDSYRRLVESNEGEKIGLVVDLSQVRRSEARNRRRIAVAIGELVPLMQDRCVAQGFVVKNQVIRAALTAVFWLKQPPWPVKVRSACGDVGPHPVIGLAARDEDDAQR